MPNERQRSLDAVAKALASMRERDESLDGLIFSGGLGFGESSEIATYVDDFITEVTEIGIGENVCENFPSVFAVPSELDATPQDDQRSAARSLDRFWTDIKDEFWRGQAVEEVAFVRGAFEDFGNWVAPHISDLPGWSPGLLPGEGSASVGRNDQIGFLLLNTCFRRMTISTQDSPAVIEPAQVAHICSGDVSSWLRKHKFVLVLSAEPFGRLEDETKETLRDLATSPDAPPVIYLSGSRVPHDDWKLLQPYANVATLGVPSIKGAETQDPTTGFNLLTLTAHQRQLRIEATPYAISRVAATPQRPSTQVVTLSYAPHQTERDPSLGPSAGAPLTATRPAEEAPVAAPDRFLADVATGRMILVVGSGLTNDLCDANGGPLSSPMELASQLGAVISSGTSIPKVSLDELLEEARRQAPKDVDRLISRSLVPHNKEIPQGLKILLSAPWSRIYYLGAHDLSGLLPSTSGNLLDGARVIDGVGSFEAPAHDHLQLVQVNGSAGTNPEGLTFGGPRASRTDSPRDKWIKCMAAELPTSPVLFLTANAEDYEFWSYLSFRSKVDPSVGGEDDLPGSYMCCPHLSTFQRQRLGAYDVKLFEGQPQDFVGSYLRTSQDAVSQGARAVVRRRHAETSGSGVSLLDALLRDAGPGDKQYLLGLEPTWGDISGDVAVPLSITERLWEQLDLLGATRMVIVKGRAGSGKSTSLMQLALRLHRQGKTILWIDRDVDERLGNLKAEIERLEPTVVFVDNAEMFGQSLASYLYGLSREGRTMVVAGMRNNRYDALVPSEFPHTTLSHDFELKDDDIRALIQQLFRRNVAGALRRQRTRDARFEEFRRRSDRELLVGLMEITTGRRFEEIIRDEYRQHSYTERLLYGVLSLITGPLFEVGSISESELLQIVGVDPPFTDIKRKLDRLIGNRHIVRTSSGVRVYHRAVGEKIIESLMRDAPEELVDIMRKTLGYYASTGCLARGPLDRNRRQMIRLLSHSLMKHLRLPSKQVNELYDSVGHWLAEDRHYWLQRGEYELEHGNFNLADNYLRQARGCEGGERDSFVLTAWGSLQLKWAVRTPEDPRSMTQASKAIETLIDVTRTEQGKAPHAFAVLARDGSNWLARCSQCEPNERRNLAKRIQDCTERGKRVCGSNRALTQAARDGEEKLSKLLRDEGPPYFRFPTVEG